MCLANATELTVTNPSNAHDEIMKRLSDFKEQCLQEGRRDLDVWEALDEGPGITCGDVASMLGMSSRDVFNCMLRLHLVGAIDMGLDLEQSETLH